MDSMGEGLWNLINAIQWVADLSESFTGARASAWEDQESMVVDYLLGVRFFPLFPMVAGDGDPRRSSRLPLV